MVIHGICICLCGGHWNQPGGWGVGVGVRVCVGWGGLDVLQHI